MLDFSIFFNSGVVGTASIRLQVAVVLHVLASMLSSMSAHSSYDLCFLFGHDWYLVGSKEKNVNFNQILISQPFQK